MENKGIDPLTNEEFTKQRSNQIFACKENQIRFNNERARQKRNAMAAINKTLYNNRNVLRSILGEEQSVQRSKDFMLGAGYEFGVFTHNMRIDNILWYCVYEYGFCALEGERYSIRRTS